MALTNAKLAKLSDTQLELHLKGTKGLIEMYDQQVRHFEFCFLDSFAQKRVQSNLSYHHEEYGLLLRELFIRKNK